MTVDFTLNIGHIITLVSTLIVFITFAQNLKWSVLNLDKRLEVVEDNQKEQTKLIIANAVMNTTIATMADKLITLEREIAALKDRKYKSRVEV